MNQERAGRWASTPEPTLHPDESGHRAPWRAPVVSRLSVDRTLFNTGSPTDSSNSGTGTPA
jgi:hypothetical protein